MRIQHNIAALNSHRQLGGNNNAVAKNLEKLSSGFRINRAGDDAAGLAISEKMRAQIKGLETASKNANDGISLVQTAEGALTEVHSMLNRMVELATQSSNGTYDNTTDRANIQKEVISLQDEVNRIADSTNFNGIKLLDGSMGTGTTGVEITGTNTVTTGLADDFTAEISGLPEDYTVNITTAVGADATQGAAATWSDKTLTITLTSNTAGDSKITQDDINTALSNATGAPEAAKEVNVKISNDITFSAASKAATDTGKIAEATKATSAAIAKTNTDGVSTNIQVTANTAGVDVRTLTIQGTGNIGATVAADTGNITLNLDASKDYTASQVNAMLSEAGADMTISYDGAVSEANLAATHTLGAGTVGAGIASGGGLSLQVGDTNESFQKVSVQIGNMGATSLGIGSIDVSTQDGAANAIKNIKNAINSVSSTRGDLGAIQNRLEHTINNLGVTTENMTAAESRVRDVDMAKEMMDFTKNNILTQAAQAMLAQANQLPQGVLQLLQ